MATRVLRPLKRAFLCIPPERLTACKIWRGLKIFISQDVWFLQRLVLKCNRKRRFSVQSLEAIEDLVSSAELFSNEELIFQNQLTEHLWLQIKLYFRANQTLFKSSCFEMKGDANYKGQNIHLSSWIIPSFLERLKNLCFLGLINWLFFNGDVFVKIGEFIIASLLTWKYNSYL